VFSLVVGQVFLPIFVENETRTAGHQPHRAVQPAERLRKARQGIL
jgi:hypothetical protein